MSGQHRRGRPKKHPPPAAIEPTRVYTREEACQVLRIGKSTLQDEVAAGRLVPAGTEGRHLYLGETLLAWLRRKTPNQE